MRGIIGADTPRPPTKRLIQEILISDVIDNTLAALRWRRYKALLLNRAKLGELHDQTVNSAGGISVRSLTLDPEFFSIQQQFLGVVGPVERLDKLTSDAEARRNSALRELDRRRAASAQRLREKLLDIEDAQFETVKAKVTKRTS